MNGKCNKEIKQNFVMGINTFYGPYLEGSRTYLVSTAQRWGYLSINQYGELTNYTALSY